MLSWLIACERGVRRIWNRLALAARSAYWRHHFHRPAPGLVVGGRLFVKHPHNVHLGEGVLIDEGVSINARAPVSLGDHVRLSAFVRINTGHLDLSVPPDQRSAHLQAPVTIGAYAWLATGVIVNPGITIGEGTVVGAGAVVASDLPPFTLCVGVPAKPIRDLPRFSAALRA